MPAGSLEKLKYAFAYGADAVYAGVPLFSLRARENEFSHEDLIEGYKYARDMGKKLYLTANIFSRNLKIKPFTRQLDRFAELKPDAFIMSDPGLISIVKDKYPEIPIHLSVQANCMNWQSVKFWQRMGIERIILSRELRIEEIREIHQQVPDIEIEAFVHGSICIAYSGRCLLSHYMSYRDANQGVCDNSCRYGFNVYKATPSNPNDEYYIEDLREKGQFYQLDEDEHGAYIMNAKDLCLIQHLRELKEAGVCSFKVEGRTKSVYYTSMISKIYRKAIDDLESGKSFDEDLLAQLSKVANRGYHKGFLMGSPNFESQSYAHAKARNQTQKFAGLVQSITSNATSVEVRSRLSVGQEIELISPNETKVSCVRRISDKNGKDLSEVHGGTGIFDVEFDAGVAIPPFSILSSVD